MPLKLDIITPEARIFSDDVDSVLVPGAEGEMGVLPGHTPLVTTLLPGELRYVQGGKTTVMAVGEGLVEVTGKSARVLTDVAVEESAIDEAKVQEAIERAEARLKDTTSMGAEEVAAVQASILKATAQLKIKRRRHSV
jgi:F-type H+-transporting ATPase subunit epsilon